MIDVFKVGVSVNLTSNGPQVLSGLMAALGRTERGATALETRLKAVHAAAVGAGMALAGLGALDGIWKVVDAGKELNHQLELMVNRGGDFAAQLGNIKSRASSVALSVPTSTPSGNVQVIGELGSQIGVDNAMDLLPTAEKLQTLLAKNGMSGKSEDIQALLKTIEIRGKLWKRGADGNEILGPDGKPQIDTASVNAEMTAAWGAISAQGGLLTPQMLLAFAQQGALAVSQQSADVFYNKGGEAAVGQGASRIGTAFASLASQMQGGVMTQRTAMEMQKLGYLKSGEWKAERGGHIVVDAAARDRLSGIIANPYKFGADLVAKLQGEGQSLNQISGELTALLGKQTTQRAINDFVRNPGSFERASTIGNQVHGIDESFSELSSKDITTNLLALNSALKGFAEDISLLAAPDVVRILHGLTDGVHTLSDEVTRHPEMAKDILELAAGLSAFLALSGGFKVASASLRLMTGALGGMVAMTNPITDLVLAAYGLPRVLHAITDFVDGLLGINPHPLNGANPKGSVGAAGDGQGANSDGNTAPANGHSGSNLHDQQYEILHPHGRASPPVHLSSYIMLDGKQIAKVVSTHQADAMSRPPSSRTGFDDRMSSYGPSQMVRT